MLPTTRDMPIIRNPFYAPRMIQVLYVDHDDSYHTLPGGIFPHATCEVTVVKLASAALDLLLNGNPPFELVVEKISSPDSYGSKLLEEAGKTDIPVVRLTDDADAAVTMIVMDHETIYCFCNEVTLAQAERLWEHMLNEKKKNKMRSNETDDDSDAGSGKRVVVEWTPELHEKFMDAVKQLGEGNCYPRDILRLMNVPGLKRRQVASHLQMCRQGNQKIKKKRAPHSDSETMSPRSKGNPWSKRLKFGVMPGLGKSPTSETNTGEIVNLDSPPLQDNVHEDVPPNEDDDGEYFTNWLTSFMSNDQSHL